MRGLAVHSDSIALLAALIVSQSCIAECRGPYCESVMHCMMHTLLVVHGVPTWGFSYGHTPEAFAILFRGDLLFNLHSYLMIVLTVFLTERLHRWLW